MQRERMSHGGASTWVLRWWQSKHEKDFLKMMSECTLAQCVHICHKMGVCVEQSCWDFTFLLLWKVMQCCVFRVTQGREVVLSTAPSAYSEESHPNFWN